MKKFILVLLGLLILVAVYFLVTRMPFPDSKARTAIGEKMIFPVRTDKLNKDIAYYAKGRGPSVIMVPSLGREASDFNELATSLITAGYRAVLVENTGIGGTTHATEDNLSKHSASITYAHMSDDSEDYGGPFFFIGHAYGNRLVRHAAYTHDLLWRDEAMVPTGVILLAAGGQVPIEPEAQKAAGNIFNPLCSYKSRMEDVRYAFFAEGNEVPDHWKRGWHTKTAMAQGKAIAASEGDESWHCAGGVPMLIVQPMQDRLAPPENAYALKDKCPQEVEIVEVQNAGHALLPEQPEAVAEAVLTFLAKHHPVN